MNFFIISAVIPAIFRDIHHTFHSPVKRSIKNPLLTFCSTFDLYFSQSLFPYLMASSEIASKTSVYFTIKVIFAWFSSIYEIPILTSTDFTGLLNRQYSDTISGYLFSSMTVPDLKVPEYQTVSNSAKKTASYC